MKNKYIVIFLLIIVTFIYGLCCINLAFALEEQMVKFKFEIDYTPNCVSECVSTNITTNETIEFITNCTTICEGTIILSPMNDDIDEETTIAYTIDLKDIGAGIAIIGYQKIQIGNESDMINVFNKLDDCLDCVDELNVCLDSNRNVSVKLMNCEKDIGYEGNYTQCDKDLNNCENNLGTKNSQLEKNEKEIKDEKSKKTWWGIGGIIIGYLIIKVIIPWSKGREIPKDEAEDQSPNVPY